MRIFITGANRGLGSAVMAAARAAGHDIVGTTRDGRDGTVALSLDDPASIAEQLAGSDAPLDLLINNAGEIGPSAQSPLAMDWAGFSHTLTVNTLAPLAVTQALLHRLRAGRSPRVVTISSQMAWMGYRKADHIAYRASKAALNKLMQGLATELEPFCIPVALIDPGWMRTDMGGPDATEDPADVARGILSVAERLTPADTGKFFRFSGEERPF
ncbi:MAG: SDR family NAD(P)-dependent oxidoreductase [Shimia sp.]